MRFECMLGKKSDSQNNSLQGQPQGGDYWLWLHSSHLMRENEVIYVLKIKSIIFGENGSQISEDLSLEEFSIVINSIGILDFSELDSDQ